MSESYWLEMLPEKAQAYGRPEADGFLVRKGSTAMWEGSPRVNRDRLVRLGVLVPDNLQDLYRLSCDYHFSSSGVAGDIVKDGNCSGSRSWCRAFDGKTIKDALG